MKNDMTNLGLALFLLALFQGALAQTYKVAANVLFDDGAATVTVTVVSGSADSDLADGEPVETSKVTLVGPDGKAELMAMQPGMHMMVPGFGESIAFEPGKSYTLELDPEGDGTVNASTTFLIPGVPVLSLEDGAAVPGVFDFTWQDPVAGTEGYDPSYLVSVDDGEGGLGVSCSVLTKEMTFVVSSEHCSDYEKGPLESLPAKAYTVSVSISTDLQGDSLLNVVEVPNNITGDNVIGKLVIFQSSKVDVTVK